MFVYKRKYFVYNSSSNILNSFKLFFSPQIYKLSPKFLLNFNPKLLPKWVRCVHWFFSEQIKLKIEKTLKYIIVSFFSSLILLPPLALVMLVFSKVDV